MVEFDREDVGVIGCGYGVTLCEERESEGEGVGRNTGALARSEAAH